MSLSASHHGSQYIDSLAIVIVENQVQYLFLRVFHHFLPRGITISRASTSKKQTHKVVHLSDSTYCGTRILIGGLLLNTDNRAQSRNLIHIGTLHPTQEITGIGRKSLNIATLAFGIKRVESQTRFTTSTQSRNYRQTVARDGNIDIFQIVYSSTEHFDIVHQFRRYFNLYSKHLSDEIASRFTLHTSRPTLHSLAVAPLSSAVWL